MSQKKVDTDTIDVPIVRYEEADLSFLDTNPMVHPADRARRNNKRMLVREARFYALHPDIMTDNATMCWVYRILDSPNFYKGKGAIILTNTMKMLAVPMATLRKIIDFAWKSPYGTRRFYAPDVSTVKIAKSAVNDYNAYCELIEHLQYADEIEVVSKLYLIMDKVGVHPQTLAWNERKAFLQTAAEHYACTMEDFEDEYKEMKDKVGVQ